MDHQFIATILFLAGIFVAFYLLVRRYGRRERAYTAALELNQKRLDQQTSRLNILTRALPNLQSLLAHSHASESWKPVCLDEGRALLKADKAGYWRFLEGEQRLEPDGERGSAGKANGTDPADAGELGEAVKHRQTILATQKDGGPFRNLIAIPLIVEGNVIGGFQFERASDDWFTQRDADLGALFVKQVSMALENRSLIENREKFYLELVQTLVDTIDSRDNEGTAQARQARVLARGMGRTMDLPEEFIYYLEMAALMHDIGNIAIDEHLLKKPGKLSTQEYEIIKKHPEHGYKILAPVSSLRPVAPMVLYHQEWFNGNGYPEGLIGEEIPLGARIVAVLDAWGAMRSPRPWRKALAHEEALQEIKRGSGTQFDPRVVDAFVSTVENLNKAASK